MFSLSRIRTPLITGILAESTLSANQSIKRSIKYYVSVLMYGSLRSGSVTEGFSHDRQKKKKRH